MALPFQRQWNKLKRGKPGQRFQDRYRAQRRDPRGRTLLRRLVRVMLALAFTAIGIVLAFIPGPAILFFLLAGAMLASDWRWMARLLDWLEVKLRAGAKRVASKWRRLPPVARIALVTAGGCLTAVTTYGAYHLIR